MNISFRLVCVFRLKFEPVGSCIRDSMKCSCLAGFGGKNGRMGGRIGIEKGTNKGKK
jgi:hypothetical protein